MLRVLAVDDEAPALEELTYLLRRHPCVGSVHPASDAAQALRDIGKMINERDRLDAVFLDIRMPGLDGLDLARLINGFADPPAMVFVTAHDEFAVSAFDFGAVDYLLKPVNPGRLSEAVRRVGETAHREATSGPTAGDTTGDTTGDMTGDTADDASAGELVPVELAGRTRLIPRTEVTYAEAHGDYVRLHTRGGAYLVRMPLATLAERWRPAGFLRIHRSTLVAVGHISELRFDDRRVVVQVGDRALPVSRRHTREVRDLLVRRFRQEARAPR